MTATEKQVGGGHYKEMAIQPAVFVTRNKLGFCEGSVVELLLEIEYGSGVKDSE